MRNLELPTRMSPCLRLFIEALFDEVAVEHGASWRQNREFHCALHKPTEKENELANVRLQ